MTPREHFAGVALQGILACPEPAGTPFDSYVERCARASVKYADALIAELAKTAPECQHNIENVMINFNSKTVKCLTCGKVLS